MNYERNKVRSIFDGLIRILPEPQKLDIKNYNGKIAIEREIPINEYLVFNNGNSDYMARIEKEIAIEWQAMYHNITMHICKLLMGKDYYYVMKLMPFAEDYFDHSHYMGQIIRLRLIADISIAQQKKVVIPTWIYREINVSVEWRCGGCNTPNIPESRWCSQCGMPRALLLQEMMCVNCGMPRIEGLSCCDRCGAEYVG